MAATVFKTASNGASPPFMAHKAEAAKVHTNKAQKMAKPTLVRWKAKLTNAGEEYCKAAVLYFEAGQVEEAKINLLKAVDCFKKKKAWYSAAKTLKHAMAIIQNQGDMASLSAMAWQSAGLFLQAGQPDVAAHLLDSTSHALEAHDPEAAIRMLEKAAETAETENRPIQAAGYVNKLLLAALRRGSPADALQWARKMLRLYHTSGHEASTGKSVLGLIVLLLGQHRTSEAEIVAREFGNNCSREQNILIEDLLDAYDQNDQYKIDSAVEHPCLQALEVEFRPVLDTLFLPADIAAQGKKRRSRSRRAIPDKKAENDSKEKEKSDKDAGDKETEKAKSK